MRSKPHPIMSSYGLCIVMLVALLTHANAIPADNSLTMTRSSPTISQPVAFNSSLDDTRAEHRLRTDTETMANDGGDNFEERLLEGIGLGTTRIRTALETAMLKLKLFINKAMTKVGLTKQSKVDKFFEQKVHKSASNADEIPKLDNPDFQAWIYFTEKTYTSNAKDADAAMVTTLVKHYGDAPLLTMLLAAETTSSMKEIADRLMKAQLTRWHTTRKSSGKVFELLKLDKVERDELLQNPMMKVWVRYVLAFDTPQTQAKMTWPLLLKHFKDEETITAVLAKALDAEETKVLARQVMQIQLEHWFIVEGKSVDKAFKLLKLDEAGDKLPMLEVWASYVRRFPEETQIKEAWPLLLKHYKDEVTLAAMLDKAADVEEMESMAKWLMVVQFQYWHEMHRSAADAFKVLKLDEAGGDVLLQNPVMRTWAMYVLTFGEKSGAKMAWPVLLKHYKDEETIIAMLAKALATEKESVTKALARQVMQIRLEHWFTVEEKSVEETFKLLKLDEAGDKLFENPMLEFWASYVRRFSKKTQIKKAWPLLLEPYKDDPSALTKKLVVAMKNEETRPVAEKLLRIQFKVWRSEKKNGVEAFKQLGLRFSDFETPLYNLWRSQVRKVFKEDVGDVLKQLSLA